MCVMKASEFNCNNNLDNGILPVGIIYNPEYGISSLPTKYALVPAETPEETGYMGLKQIDSLNGDTIKMKAGIFVVKKTKSGYHIYYQCNKCSDPHHSATCDLVLGT